VKKFHSRAFIVSLMDVSELFLLFWNFFINSSILKHFFFLQLLATFSIFLSVLTTSSSLESLWPNYSLEKCSGGGKLKYISGDALSDPSNCLGPNGLPYPSATISRAFSGSSRKGRQSQFPSTVDPMVMQSALLNAYREANDEPVNTRQSKTLFY
jgi:hypothetical protein